ncbi:hypothetical protein L3V82_04245 [Thiotrichales bacterium 19S3-7]|nr:hypothetical protein [Thiotrichales bacterium 19S3-7]MCF6802682.1 hypothetical protein [Thiotrichales bacterium 19S3-11]
MPLDNKRLSIFFNMHRKQLGAKFIPVFNSKMITSNSATYYHGGRIVDKPSKYLFITQNPFYAEQYSRNIKDGALYQITIKKPGSISTPMTRALGRQSEFSFNLPWMKTFVTSAGFDNIEVKKLSKLETKELLAKTAETNPSYVPYIGTIDSGYKLICRDPDSESRRNTCMTSAAIGSFIFLAAGLACDNKKQENTQQVAIDDYE